MLITVMAEYMQQYEMHGNLYTLSLNHSPMQGV